MDAMVRGTLDVGVELRAFGPTVSNPTVGGTTAQGDLDQALTVLKTDAEAEADARLGRRNSTATKRAQRRKVQRGLRHLHGVARRAMAEVPGTELNIEYVGANVPDQQFLARARTAEANAMASKDLLVQNGLAESVLTEFTAGLDQFEKSLAQSETSRQKHVAARANMLDGSRKVRRIARVLDTLYRAQFQDDPEMLAKWVSASAGLKARPKARKSAPATPAAPVPPAPGADVRPAA